MSYKNNRPSSHEAQLEWNETQRVWDYIELIARLPLFVGSGMTPDLARCHQHLDLAVFKAFQSGSEASALLELIERCRSSLLVVEGAFDARHLSGLPDKAADDKLHLAILEYQGRAKEQLFPRFL